MKQVIDKAGNMPLTPATAAVTALDLMGRDNALMACCPKDGEPLISTFKYSGAEFVCMVCGNLYGFLSPTPKDADTPGLQERYGELRARFDAGIKPGE